MTERVAASGEGNPYLGWIVGGLIILAVFAVMGAFWFMYHPF